MRSDGSGASEASRASAQFELEMAVCFDHLAPLLGDDFSDADAAVVRAALGGVGRGTCDWFAACMFVVVGDIPCAKRQLDALERSATAPFVWYQLGRRRAVAEGRVLTESYALKMVAEVDRVVQVSLFTTVFKLLVASCCL